MEEDAEAGEEGQAGAIDQLTDARPATSPADSTDDDPAPATSALRTAAARAANSAAAPYLVVTVLALAVTRAFWVPGRYVVSFDAYAYSGPNLEVTERALRDFRLPQINDMIFGGVPHLGNPPASVLYPAHLLTLLLETNRAMGVVVALHVVLLGTGMVLLARRLGTGRLGAAVAGGAAVSSGAVLAKTTQFEQIMVVAWIPLLLVAIHATLHAERPWRAMAALAATTAAVLLAGHPQLVYEAIVLAAAATIGFAFRDDRWRRLPRVAGGTGLGVLIALPHLVAGLVSAEDSAVQVGRTFAELEQRANVLNVNEALRAILGTPQAIDPAIFASSFESVGFIGVTMALLALIGWRRTIADDGSRPWAISLALFSIIALLWSTGPNNPVFRVAYDFLPGFDLARVSARWVVMIVLVIALLAGFGADALVERARRGDVWIALVSTVGFGLLVAFGVLDAFAGRTALIWGVTAAMVTGLTAVAVGTTTTGSAVARFAGGAIIVILVLELGLMSRQSFPQQLRSDTPFTAYRSVPTEWLEGRAGHTIALTDDGRGPDYQVPALRPNTNSLWEIRSIDGYDGGVQITARWAAALRRFTEEPFVDLPMRNSLTLPLEPDVLARLGVRFVLLDWKRPANFIVPEWSGPVARDDDLGVFENPAWLGEAVAWRVAEPVGPDVAAADLLRTVPHRYSRAALVDDRRAALECDGSPRECSPVGLDVVRHHPEHLEVRTALDEPTVVMVTQQALPGWHVTVDGRGADELTVDGLFLGVAVPAGDHVVEWRYRSPLLTPTLAVALLAGLATVGLALSDTIRSRVARARHRP